MTLIMPNPTERDLIRMRRDAQIDWNSMMCSAEKKGHTKEARRMKADGMATTLIARYTGLTKKRSKPCN